MGDRLSALPHRSLGLTRRSKAPVQGRTVPFRRRFVPILSCASAGVLRPFGPLAKGFLISVVVFGLVALALSLQFLATTGAPVAVAVMSSARDWMPWMILTPLLFRLTNRFPFGRRHWRSRLALHLAACAMALLLCHLWKEAIDPGFRAGPGGRPRPGGVSAGPPPSAQLGPRPARGPFFDLVHIGTFQLPLYLMIICAAHASFFYRQDRDRSASLTLYLVTLRAGVTTAAASQTLSPTKFQVRNGQRTTFVSPEEIDRIEADGNYAILHVGPRNHLLRATMSALEAELPEDFARTSRSSIVNLRRVQELQSIGNNHCALLPEDARVAVTGSIRELQQRLRALS